MIQLLLTDTKKAERISPSCLNASKCSMNMRTIKLTSNKCRRKLDTQRTRDAEETR